MIKAVTFLLGALGFAAAIAWFSAALAYGFGSRTSVSAWPLALAAIGMALGFLILARAPLSSRIVRNASLVAYVPLSLAACWFVLVLTACSFGDCI